MGYPDMNMEYCSSTHGNTSARSWRAIKYIVVHYTGTSASARNACIYFNREGASTNASADYFIDKDGGIYKYNIHDGRYTWHCGDGHGAYGITNANSIGIEVVSAGEDFTEAQVESLRKLVAAIMEDYGIPAERVVRHYDASRKHCPAPYVDSAKWQALHARITGGEQGEWVKNAVGWWWRRPDGSWPASQWMKIGGWWYWFKESGYAAEGEWLKIAGDWYWFYGGGGCRAAQGECLKIEGKWYAFDSSCRMLRTVGTNAGGDLVL